MHSLATALKPPAKAYCSGLSEKRPRPTLGPLLMALFGKVMEFFRMWSLATGSASLGPSLEGLQLHQTSCCFSLQQEVPSRDENEVRQLRFPAARLSLPIAISLP